MEKPKDIKNGKYGKYRKKYWWEKEREEWEKPQKQESWDEDSDGWEDNYEFYNYDFNQQLGKEKQVNEWEEYEKTGFWKGYEYYKKPQLDYRYIEQMANAFAAKYKIEVRIGKNWAIDLEKKTLIYDPLTLIHETKAYLIATLLHEIGHLRHTETVNNIKKKGGSPYIEKYFEGAFEVLNMFEDFRIDALMAKAYEGAEDVYKANKPVIEKMAQKYAQQGDYHREIILSFLEKNSSMDKDERKEFFGTSDVKLIDKKIEELKKRFLERDTLFDYCAYILMEGYGGKYQLPPTGKMISRVQKTKHIAKEAVTATSTFGVLKMLDKKVYPAIEDLLKDINNVKEVEEIFGSKVAARAASQFSSTGMGPKTLETVRVSGESQSRIPIEWQEGDYTALKESVQSSINELVRKLTFLRRTEQAMKWTGNMKRGRLNIKGLFRQRLGNTRLFKQKAETRDTIKSFAFSLVLDVSYSMYGERLIHSTRGLIILAEVFKKMEIPFEIVMFSDTASIVKGFDEGLKSKQQKIGGLAKVDGNGTNLYTALDMVKIGTRPERNKFMILLTDGGIGNRYDYYKERFEKLETKDNIKTIGFGIDSGKEILKLCSENGRIVENPNSLPQEFAELLKSLIKRR